MFRGEDLLRHQPHRSGVVQRDKERTGLLIVVPRPDTTRLCASAVVVNPLLDAVVGANEELPNVAG